MTTARKVQSRVRGQKLKLNRFNLFTGCLLISALITYHFLLSTVYAQSASPSPTTTLTPTPTPPVVQPTTPHDCGIGCKLTSSLFNYFINGQTSIEGAIGHTILCSLTGISPLNKCGGYAYHRDQGASSFLIYDQLPNGGALGTLGSTTVALYTNPPTSTVAYLAGLGENIGLSPPAAYAQEVTGSGHGVISPVLKLWQVTRNMAYLGFILIFMAVGFMIMFRKKINPQTVISVQAALPSLIIGLILITFSYFIAALAIDLGFITIQLVAQLFVLSGVDNILGTPSQLAQAGQNSNIFQLFLHTGVNTVISGVPFNAVQNQYISALNSVAPGIFNQSGVYFIPGLLGAIVGGIMLLGPFVWTGVGVGALLGVAGPFLVPLIVIIVLVIALFVQLFKLVFQLIITYVQILIFTLAGPFLILYGSLPGNGNATSFWFRGLIANSLVFVFVFGAFLFAGAIIGNQNALTSTLPLLGGIQGDFIKILIGYGIILGTPAIPDMVRGLFKVQFPPQLMKEAAAGAGAGFGAIRTGFGQATRSARTLSEAVSKAETDAEVARMTGQPARVVAGPRNRWEALGRAIGRLR